MIDCEVIWTPLYASLMKIGNVPVSEVIQEKPKPIIYNQIAVDLRHLGTEEAARRDRLRRSLQRYHAAKKARSNG